MLFTGDVVLNQTAPVFMGVADPKAYLTLFEELPKRFDIQAIVPEHGKIGGIEILESFKQFLNDMKLAASDNSKESELLKKYKDWSQVPFIMSPGATISAFKK
jgi:hypothetical protein